jgi:hypothetical protein
MTFQLPTDKNPFQFLHGIHSDEYYVGQAVGIKEVHDDIWLVSFMDYDLGYFDLETRELEPLDNPFGPRLRNRAKCGKRSTEHSKGIGKKRLSSTGLMRATLDTTTPKEESRQVY